MKDIFISLIICVLLSFSTKQTKLYNNTQNDVILWKSNSKITWDNFKGPIDQTSKYKALTYVQIGLESKENQNLISINVPCFFIKNLSWTKEKSINLLKHEQLHFDIAELVARKIRQEFINYKSTDIKKTYIDLQEIYRINYRVKLDSINRAYDEETNHSIITEKQKEWELKIAKELQAMEKYSSTKVVIKREKPAVKQQDKNK